MYKCTISQTVYVDIIRGTPTTVQLLIMWSGILATCKNSVLIASLTFGINSGAYVAEIVRAGILAVDKGQMEAGRSLGLNKFQTMRYIIIPQAFKSILPPLGNEFIVQIFNDYHSYAVSFPVLQAEWTIPWSVQNR